MTKKEKEMVEQYKRFMYNPDNINHCDGCPENEGFSNWQDRKPCGQYTCWVTTHCYGGNYK